ncbi:type II secretion system protein GspL [Marinagarivorans algicola]|uniref:type II secretion system protein GspL n=1 Tax=Marinagarivorans algicola TaxID=1513270 RepID=UPI0006B9C5DF|nr:type II secretion system protein GspL [Marinagarivorans algicola]
MAERILVRKIEPGLWQWRVVTSQNQWLSESFYTGDINLLAESVAGKACWLLLDGRTVSSQVVDVGVKDRKLLSKLVPFEVEETVVTPVDELIFAYGPLEDGLVSTQYVKEDSVAELIAELEELGAEVQSVGCDYAELDEGEGWVFLLEDKTFFAKIGSHQGFSCEATVAQLFIQALCTEADKNESIVQPAALHLVAETEEALVTLRNWLPKNLEVSETLSIYEQEGGFWDAVALRIKPVMEFRSGNLARKLPFGVWWNDWKIPAIAASIAFIVALGTTWGEFQQAKKESMQLFSDRDAVFRQVVSSGSITDPVRQLRAKLQKQTSTEPSNVVFLVSKVAPEIRKNKNLNMTSFRYTQNNGALQFSVEAKDFAMLEALRGDISKTGLAAEIRNSKVSGDIHQAQIRVTES